MEKLNERARVDNHIMGLLKTNATAHHLFNSDKGPVFLNLRKGGIGKDYFVTMDAVPLEEKIGKEIIELLVK